jgi:hypothetical protein
MSFAAAATIACLVTIVAGIAATHHLELREHRWLKIALSLPLVVLITSVFHQLHAVSGYFAMWSIGILAFIWKSPIAHFFTFGFTKLIHGNPNQASGIRAEIAGPRALFKHGDLEEALRLTLQELEKEEFNYDGLLLLADIHEAMNQPAKATEALTKLLRRRGLTANQRKMIRARTAKIEEKILIATLNAK